MKYYGNIIITTAGPITTKELLDIEMYLNDVVGNLVYANKGAVVRVHMADPGLLVKPGEEPIK